MARNMLARLELDAVRERHDPSLARAVYSAVDARISLSRRAWR